MTEYRVIFLTNTSHEATAEMNRLAADGWRFVATIGPLGSMGVIMARGEQGVVLVPSPTIDPLPYVPGTAL